ncbi:hypothetical protein E4U53_004357, partial [Claviceps sorghi]
DRGTLTRVPAVLQPSSPRLKIRRATASESVRKTVVRASRPPRKLTPRNNRPQRH